MSGPGWLAAGAAIDKGVGGRIRDLMKQQQSLECLNKDIADVTARAAKVKEDREKYENMKPAEYPELYAAFFAATDCFTADERIPKVNYMVSGLTYGTPFVPAALTKVDEGKSEEELRFPTDNDAVVAFLKDVIEFAEISYPEGSTGVKVRIDGIALAIEDFIGLALSDTLKALFSMAFVFLYLNFHLQSCFLSCLGMGIIVLSFPFTVIITNAIFQIKYFGFL